MQTKLTRYTPPPINTAELEKVAPKIWRPIEQCPEHEQVLFISYIAPSIEAAKHGSNAYYAYGTGYKIGKIYSGIIGGKPLAFMPLPTPPKGGSDGNA